MNTELERRKQEITRSQGRRKLWQRIVSALAAVVMFVTTYVLILPVEAQNRTFCEMEAHEHSAENGCYVETKTLKCEEKHEHTDECYITLLTLICQHEEHIHNKECYADKTADIETQADWEASIKAAKLTGNWSEDIIAIASTQLGYRESERNYILGENNEIKGYTRYGDWIGDKYTDWSAAFVAFCVNYTGISKDEMTYDKVPEQWMELVKSAKLFNENITETNPGDIVFIDSDGDNKADRVGIVVEQSEDKIKTVEGDLNNAVAYFEYELSAQTARTDVEFSDENSNNKDFSEEKSATGRSGREASQTPNIIGSVSLPKNPNYVKPIDTLDPENPDATTEPGSRVQNSEEPSATHDNKGNTRAANIPVLIDPTNSIALINETSGALSYYGTLQAAMNAIGSGSDEYTIVFCRDYNSSDPDWAAVRTQGGSAQKITFTSTYNDGSQDIKRTLAYSQNGASQDLIFNFNTEFRHIIFNQTGSWGFRFFANNHKFTIGEGFEGTNANSGVDYNFTGQIFGGAREGNQTLNTDITVLSGYFQIYAGTAVASSYNMGAGGNINVHVGGTARINTIILMAYGKVLPDGHTINYYFDGTDGATVSRISFHEQNQGTGGPGKANISVTVRNMKGINYLDGWCEREGFNGYLNINSGSIRFEGDCHIANAMWATDKFAIELADGAVLRMGSDDEGTMDGATTGYTGAIYLDNMTMNEGSKLVMAGTSIDTLLNTTANHRIGTLNIVGSGCEILIYKRASTTYPLVISEKRGDNQLALGILKALNVDTADPFQKDALLVFSTEANAKAEDYLPGSIFKGETYEKNIYAIDKRGANIVPVMRPINPITPGTFKSVLQLPTEVYTYPDSIFPYNESVTINNISNNAVVGHFKYYNAAKIGNQLYDIEWTSTLCAGLDYPIQLSGLFVMRVLHSSYDINPEFKVNMGSVFSSGQDLPVGHRVVKNTIKLYKSGSSIPISLPKLLFGDTVWAPAYNYFHPDGNVHIEVFGWDDKYQSELYAVNPSDFAYSPEADAYICMNGRLYFSASEDGVLFALGEDGAESLTLYNCVAYADQNFTDHGISCGGLEFALAQVEQSVVSSAISVEKHFSGTPATQTASATCTFTVESCDANGDTSHPGLQEISNSTKTELCTEGSVVSGFGTAKYYMPGTYYSLITEAACTGNYVVDTTRYLQTVEVVFDDATLQLSISNTTFKNLETGETVDRPSFNNIYSLHKLTINEEIIGGGSNTAFPFTVEITDSTGNNIYQVPSADITVYDAAGNDVTPATIARDTEGNPVISLGDGWSIVIENIPHNYIVTITETDFGGYSCDISGDGTETAPDSGITRPIVMNGDKTVDYLNERSTVELTITKTVVGGGTGPFSFEITFTDASGDPVNIPQPAANSGYTVTNNVASFDLNKDGSVTITGIPVGTVATIVETSHAGYTVQYNFSDGTPSVSGDTSEVTITDDLTVTCINNAGFELPHTGGTGSLILTLGGVILVATALMYGICLKRRQWRAWI